MEFSDEQVRQLKAKLDGNTLRRAMQTGRPSTMSKGGTRLPRPTASLVSMRGTAEPFPPPVCTAIGAAETISQPISPRCG